MGTRSAMDRINFRSYPGGAFPEEVIIMKNKDDIIMAMLDSLAYELISAYRDYYNLSDDSDFLSYICRIYDQVEEDQKDGN